MGGYALACIKVLVGWIKSLAEQMWSVFSTQPGKQNNLMTWTGDHWKAIVLVLCVFGLAADLVVYLFRWEPIKVWRSWFRRRKQKNRAAWPAPQPQPAYYEDDDTAEINPDGAPYFASNRRRIEQDYPEPYADDGLYPEEEEPDAGMAQTRAVPRADQPLYSAPNMPAPPEYQAMYRRPEPRDTAERMSMTERNLEKVIGPRRRKFRVNELFADSEESSVHYEAPQPVIDRTEAYNAPVYPRNWKENGEDPS